MKLGRALAPALRPFHPRGYAAGVWETIVSSGAGEFFRGRSSSRRRRSLTSLAVCRSGGSAVASRNSSRTVRRAGRVRHASNWRHKSSRPSLPVERVDPSTSFMNSSHQAFATNRSLDAILPQDPGNRQIEGDRESGAAIRLVVGTTVGQTQGSMAISEVALHGPRSTSQARS